MNSNPLFVPDSTTGQTDEELFESRFKRLCNSDVNSDCEFIVGDKKVVIKGHKLIFSAASEVFHAMFFGGLKETSAVVITDLKPAGFLSMKVFIYTGEVNFESVMHALATLIAGRKYLIPKLDLECIKYIKEHIDTSNLLELYESSHKVKILEFTEICRRIISLETYDVLNSNYFLTTHYNIVHWILRFTTLDLKSEVDLFEYLERWTLAEAKRKNVKADEMASKFNNLKCHIRFLSMDPKEFATRVSKTQLLTEHEKLAISLNLIKPGSMPYPENLSVIKKGRRSII